MVDDLKPTIGTYGDTLTISPNIDQLAAEGMGFAYSNQADTDYGLKMIFFLPQKMPE